MPNVRARSYAARAPAASPRSRRISPSSYDATPDSQPWDPTSPSRWGPSSASTWSQWPSALTTWSSCTRVTWAYMNVRESGTDHRASDSVHCRIRPRSASSSQRWIVVQ